MSQQFYNSSSCSLIPGRNGDLQVVHARGAQVVLFDVQSSSRDTLGHIRHAHSTLQLNYDAVCELRALLDHIDEPYDDRQPSLWSDSTFVDPIRPPARNRRRRRTS